MTKSALEHHLQAKEHDLQREKMNMTREENAKQRAHEKEENKKSRRAQIIGNVIGAGGKIAARMIKNDPEWYKQYVVDLSVFTNLPTYDRLGSVHLGTAYSEDEANQIFVDVPGIMIMSYAPVIGNQRYTLSDIYRNPINQILARSKEKILALNSRSNVNWEPSDLGLNMFCSADILTAILDLRRVISVYNTYSGTNAYLARTLIEALGWNYADISANFSDYRKSYVKFVKRFNSSIVAPLEVTLFKRRAFLASNIFLDSGDIRYPRQMYAYRQDKYFTLNAVGDGATFASVTWRNNFNTFEAVLNSMFSAIVDNPDFIEMYQDLRHAVGDKIVTLSEDISSLEVDFNIEELNREAIHNFKCLPLVTDTNGTRTFATVVDNNFNLREDSSGYLYQGSSSDIDRYFDYATTDLEIRRAFDYLYNNFLAISGKSKQLLNMHKKDVNGDDILDITRWTYTVTPITVVGNQRYILRSCGTELGLGIFVYDHVYDTASQTGYTTITESSSYVLGNASTSVTWSDMTLFASLRSAFDWAPIFHHITSTGGDVRTAPFVDAYTTFSISNDNVTNLNSACVLSELYLNDKGYIS